MAHFFANNAINIRFTHNKSNDKGFVFMNINERMALSYNEIICYFI